MGKVALVTGTTRVIGKEAVSLNHIFAGILSTKIDKPDFFGVSQE